MTTKLRRFLLLTLTGGLFLAAIAVLVNVVVMGSYEQLERSAVDQSIRQVERALDAELKQMAVVNNDYANWDEMFDFVRSKNTRFTETNFSQAGLQEMNVNLVFVVDERGEEVFSAEQMPGQETLLMPATPGMRQAIAARLGAIREQLASGREALLVPLPGGIALLTANKIMPTARTGADRGTLVFVRLMTGAVAENLANTSQLPVVWWDTRKAPSFALPPQVLQAVKANTADQTRLSHIDDRNEISAYTVMRDIDGKSALLLAARLKRDVYNVGRQTANYLLGSVATLVLIVLLTVYVLDSRLERSSRLIRQNQELYQAVVEQADEAIVLLDPETQEILQVNSALAHITGRELAELRSRPLEEILDAASVPLYWNLLANASSDARVPTEMRLQTRDGARCDVDVAANTLSLNDRRIVCLLIRDLSPKRQAEARLRDHERKLEHLANHDPLTGLPNRVYVGYRLPALLDETAKLGQRLAVMHIDVDSFKSVNDVAGHDVGDSFLVAIAERLRGVVASEDLVARISGDEFVVVVRAAEPQVFQIIAKRVADKLREPINIAGRGYTLSSSAGVARFPEDGRDASELLRHADIALYHAKKRGKDLYLNFEAEMTQKVNERAHLEQALRAAIAEQKLSIHLQPILDLQNERVVGLEALARWHHPEFGNVPPLQFIPVAEECGLIIDLGEVVLRQACRQLAEWQRTGVPLVPIAVNVSAQQLQRVNLAALIKSATDDAGISPTLIEIELTESVIMSEIERHIGTLATLRSMGVKVSIDDFGTGYSSLSYLKHLPIDYLKIDRSFVRDMTTDENDAAIVSAIISMARSLQLKTIAEGVETLEHASRLAAAGCDFAQGYYYSSPLPAAECGLLLTELQRIGGQSDQFKTLVDSVRETAASQQSAAV
jgi:diguanylate cyclase (GGDEF)-like protein/PAS domain S-box-containing protein